MAAVEVAFRNRVDQSVRRTTQLIHEHLVGVRALDTMHTIVLQREISAGC